MTIRVVSRSTAAAGFQLAGLPVLYAEESTTAAEQIRRLAADPTVGIVLVDEVLYRALPPDLVKRLDRRAVPIFTPVPGPRWDERSDAEAYILEILRQAIGYRVRPR